MPTTLSSNGIIFPDLTEQTSALPTGIIAMWSGSLVNLPESWAICDGTNGTPDLRSRFIVGAGSSFGVGCTGGCADATVPCHTHPNSTTSSEGIHQHSISGSDHSHSANALAASCSGGHRHLITNNLQYYHTNTVCNLAAFDISPTNPYFPFSCGGYVDYILQCVSCTFEAGEHTHQFCATTNTASHFHETFPDAYVRCPTTPLAETQGTWVPFSCPGCHSHTNPDNLHLTCLDNVPSPAGHTHHIGALRSYIPVPFGTPNSVCIYACFPSPSPAPFPPWPSYPSGQECFKLGRISPPYLHFHPGYIVTHPGHTHDLGVCTNGTHCHGVFLTVCYEGNVAPNNVYHTHNKANAAAWSNVATYSSGDHCHFFCVSSVGTSLSSNGDHCHAVTISPSGSLDILDKNLPPYYVLAFIMKV